MFKKVLAIILTLCFAGMTAGGCGNNESGKTDETTAQAETKAAEIKTNLPKLDMKKWQYDEDDKIYYQLGLDYCEKPADKTYEQLAVFVPAAYMDGTKNSDGSYTCKFNESAKVSGYTAAKSIRFNIILDPFCMGGILAYYKHKGLYKRFSAVCGIDLQFLFDAFVTDNSVL